MWQSLFVCLTTTCHSFQAKIENKELEKFVQNGMENCWNCRLTGNQNQVKLEAKDLGDSILFKLDSDQKGSEPSCRPFFIIMRQEAGLLIFKRFIDARELNIVKYNIDLYMWQSLFVCLTTTCHSFHAKIENKELEKFVQNGMENCWNCRPTGNQNQVKLEAKDFGDFFILYILINRGLNLLIDLFL